MKVNEELESEMERRGSRKSDFFTIFLFVFLQMEPLTKIQIGNEKALFIPHILEASAVLTKMLNQTLMDESRSDSGHLRY